MIQTDNGVVYAKSLVHHNLRGSDTERARVDMTKLTVGRITHLLDQVLEVMSSGLFPWADERLGERLLALRKLLNDTPEVRSVKIAVE